MLFFEPVVIRSDFVADEFGVLQVTAHFGGDGVGLFDAFAECCGFADEDDGTAAAEAEGRPELGVCGKEDFAVEGAVAWPGALVEDGGVFPEGKVGFDALEACELGPGVAHGAFGSVDGFEPEGGELGDAELVELCVDGDLPVLKAVALGECVGEALFEGVADSLVFDEGGGEAFEAVKCCGALVTVGDVSGYGYFGIGGKGGCVVVGVGLFCQLVEVSGAVCPGVVEFDGEGVGKGVDEVGVGLRVEQLLSRGGQGFFFNRA